MPIPINNLQGVDITVGPSDPDYNLAQAMLEWIFGEMGPLEQSETPNSGDTIILKNPKRNGILNIHGDDPIATLTIQLPPDDQTTFGQTRMICAEVDIESLSIVLTGTTIRAVPESLPAGENFIIQKINSNLWTRIGF